MRSSVISSLLLASSVSALYIEPSDSLIPALPVQANIRVGLGEQQTPRTVPPVTKGTLKNAPRADGAASMKETTWNPPKYLVADLEAVRGKTTTIYGNRLYMGTGFHQIIANKGYFNYCVRWDSKSTADAKTRTAVNQSIQTQFKKWMDVMKGFQGWPYNQVKVNIVGWAARSTSLLPGGTDGTYKIYTSTDAQGVPICDVKCSRSRRPSNYKTACPDKGKHFDNELWLKDGLKGGKGNFNFHQVGKEYYLGEMTKGKPDIHIYLHEVGHTFALMDYYNWRPPTQRNFLMWAGSAEWITEFDAWQIRDIWRRVGPTLIGNAAKDTSRLMPPTSNAMRNGNPRPAQLTTTLGQSNRPARAPQTVQAAQLVQVVPQGASLRVAQAKMVPNLRMQRRPWWNHPRRPLRASQRNSRVPV